jgi:signal transduction histidine kinase
VILCGYAALVGSLTTQRLDRDFERQVVRAADTLQEDLEVRYLGRDEKGRAEFATNIKLNDFVSGRGTIRVVYGDGTVLLQTNNAADLGPPLQVSSRFGGYRVETRAVKLLSLEQPGTLGTVYVQYGRRLADVGDTVGRVRLFLGLGVLGGVLLALLAGVATARRAMAPIAELTAAAREVERTGDPTVRIPRPEATDEVAELADTLDEMLRSLHASRGESEALLTRQREFVADASHELRTPLTSILANLELLSEVLDGEPREAAASALRSAQRMRRLVADLLLLARADAGRVAPSETLDLGDVVAEAVAELEPTAQGHPITVDAEPGATIAGTRDELHRLVANLLENALRHTDPGTAVEASVERSNGEVVLCVEDDGPGIPVDQREKVFERFYRGAGEQSGSSGLGLAIVRAVAESHGGTVRLVEPLDGRGARFVVRLPAA